MDNRVARYLVYAVWLCCTILLAACSRADDEPAGNDSQDGETMLSFVVTASRADGSSSDEREVGTVNENRIDIDNADYRILLFDSNNKFLARCYGVFTATNTTDYTEYKFVGTVPTSLTTYTGGGVTVVVLANWGWYEDSQLVAGETTISDLTQATWAQFDYSSTTTEEILDGTRPIPMYGAQAYTGITFAEGKTTDLTATPITLTRAMAKVELIVGETDDNSTFDFKNPKLVNYNAKGYCTEGIPNGVEKYSSVNFVKDEDTGKWVVYMPEYKNLSDESTLRTDGYKSYINVQLSFQTDDDTKTFDIQFANYDANSKPTTYFNIERNHLYRYEVDFKQGELIVTNGDWQKVYDLDFDFGEETK